MTPAFSPSLWYYLLLHIYTPVRVQPEKNCRDRQEVFVARSWLPQVRGWLRSLARAGSPTQVMDLKSLWGRESGRGSRAGWNPTSMSWSPGSGGDYTWHQSESGSATMYAGYKVANVPLPSLFRLPHLARISPVARPRRKPLGKGVL